MDTEKINSWLILIANLGVLIGLIVVVIELQQTQVMMSADIQYAACSNVKGECINGSAI